MYGNTAIGVSKVTKYRGQNFNAGLQLKSNDVYTTPSQILIVNIKNIKNNNSCWCQKCTNYYDF